MEIDIRGMTFDEAEPLIDRYLDDASNAGLESVSIIHGKGTGMLRKKVQGYLTSNPRVENHRLGYWNEGSSGVTVVTIKKD
jgi:DNA mismatch repair protein MutS2